MGNVESENGRARTRAGAGDDEELGALYRDWVALWDYRESAYPSAETLRRYAGWARRLLAGERISPRPPEEFARFVRVRREGRRRGLGLAAAFEAYRRGQDFPAGCPSPAEAAA